ncbi:hypothetical protein DYD21_11695 [Rhodohalobacter sp. SW132]|uniref:hypothetical protein n=1 Tax=Rhodohalobacter sp. SW132 TaxID=2293433 RepID=UPI000E25A79F|nr:hypothetical protein [Rhodohalobacter sp. SW132]REL33429.1 hypothetical protein DYD21_11695 [Rhodohalobacter sp. SW132]
MRTSNITLIVVITAFLFLLFSSLHAQSSEDASIVITDYEIADCTNMGSFETDRKPINTILEEDYPFLRTIHCMKNDDFLKSRGWNWKLKNLSHKQATHYVLSGKGAKINVRATYDKDGNLVESLLRINDTHIPHAILEFIFYDKYEGWHMIANEKIVKDFDTYQTEYNIILSDGSMEQVLNFKEYGNRIAFSGIISRDERTL